MKRDTARDILPPGSVFEKYTVYKRLGSGGMGAVYLVRHNILDTLFALKILHPDAAQQTGSFVSRFLREGKLASSLKHPNLIEVHDAGHNAATDIYYIVMDYVSGGNLRSRLNKTGKLSLAESLPIITGIAHALNVAHHAGIVHRDIKPENIMFDTGGTVKLADLGIAKVSGPSGSALTVTSAVIGTPAYMSPEQALDSSKVDCRADIYSLGIVFFEMLAGRLPFDSLNPIELLSQLISGTPLPDVRDFCKDIPEDTARLIEDMTRKDIKKRIQTPEELLYRLSRLSSGAGDVGNSSENRGSNVTDFVTLPTMLSSSGSQELETQVTLSSVPENGSKTIPCRQIGARQANWSENSAEIGKKTPASGSFNLRSYGKIIAVIGIPLLLLAAAAVVFFLKATVGGNSGNSGISGRTAGNSGNSGISGRTAGNTGNSGNSGISGRTAGNTGNSGISGRTAGNSGISGRTAGNTGNSGISGRTAGNSGNSGISGRTAGITGTAIVELEPKASFTTSSAEQEFIPAKEQMQLPPPHSVILLAPADFRSGLLSEQLKKNAGKQVFLAEIESPGRFRDQIRQLLSCSPDMMIIVPVRHFVRSGISLTTFEMLLTEAADRIREKNVPLQIVCPKPAVTRKEKDFVDLLEHICARRSLDLKTVAPANENH